ncbi:hypothetical protein [Arthrobacter ruber]|uniref:hypothetical protein n=1 Tax=Arthrobacter ruber TaxID=1258893 RepID=UPI000CF402CF|nr:hypothetical protein [Arthrobacter ruber]
MTTETETDSHREPYDRPWSLEPGDLVELHRQGTKVRLGTVEAVMPDGSGFWIGAFGADERQFVDSSDETLTIWF